MTTRQNEKRATNVGGVAGGRTAAAAGVGRQGNGGRARGGKRGGEREKRIKERVRTTASRRRRTMAEAGRAPVSGSPTLLSTRGHRGRSNRQKAGRARVSTRPGRASMKTRARKSPIPNETGGEKKSGARSDDGGESSPRSSRLPLRPRRPSDLGCWRHTGPWTRTARRRARRSASDGGADDQETRTRRRRRASTGESVRVRRGWFLARGSNRLVFLCQRVRRQACGRRRKRRQRSRRPSWRPTPSNGVWTARRRGSGHA